jgi:hypothetical protein
MKTIYFVNHGPDASHRWIYREFVRLGDAKEWASNCSEDWEIGKMQFSKGSLVNRVVIGEKPQQWQIQARRLGKSYAMAQEKIRAERAGAGQVANSR